MEKTKKFFLSLFVLVIVILAGISFYRYAYLLKQNYNLNTKLREIESKIEDLNNVKTELENSLKKEQEEVTLALEEKQQLKEQISVLQVNMNQKEADLTNTKNELTQVQSKIEFLNRDYTALQEKTQQLRQERDTFEAKLNSLPELKKAIKLLRKKFYQTQENLQRERDDTELEEGNKGFMLWQGKSTIKEKVKIEVLPFEP